MDSLHQCHVTYNLSLRYKWGLCKVVPLVERRPAAKMHNGCDRANTGDGAQMYQHLFLSDLLFFSWMHGVHWECTNTNTFYIESPCKIKMNKIRVCCVFVLCWNYCLILNPLPCQRVIAQIILTQYCWNDHILMQCFPDNVFSDLNFMEEPAWFLF